MISRGQLVCMRPRVANSREINCTETNVIVPQQFPSIVGGFKGMKSSKGGIIHGRYRSQRTCKQMSISWRRKKTPDWERKPLIHYSLSLSSVYWYTLSLPFLPRSLYEKWRKKKKAIDPQFPQQFKVNNDNQETTAAGKRRRTVREGEKRVDYTCDAVRLSAAAAVSHLMSSSSLLLVSIPHTAHSLHLMWCNRFFFSFFLKCAAHAVRLSKVRLQNRYRRAKAT
jgi:hypothetical protein